MTKEIKIEITPRKETEITTFSEYARKRWYINRVAIEGKLNLAFEKFVLIQIPKAIINSLPWVVQREQKIVFPGIMYKIEQCDLYKKFTLGETRFVHVNAHPVKYSKEYMNFKKSIPIKKEGYVLKIFPDYMVDISKVNQKDVWKYAYSSRGLYHISTNVCYKSIKSFQFFENLIVEFGPNYYFNYLEVEKKGEQNIEFSNINWGQKISFGDEKFTDDMIFWNDKRSFRTEIDRLYKEPLTVTVNGSIF